MILQSFIIAFAMYSKIPMPKVDWNEKNMRYAMCFFPFVGAVIGAVCFAVMKACEYANVGIILRTGILTAVPLLITGGIHMDGFLDTVDAISSYGDKEKRLEILKDPHAGAFAIIFCGVYLLLDAGLWSEVGQDSRVLLLVAVTFMLSRTLSGLSVVSFKMAKDTGLAKTFADGADKLIVRIWLCILLLGEIVSLYIISGWKGLIVALAAILVFIYYFIFSKVKFGGITGDLCGYFLELCELAMLAAIVIVQCL